METDQGTGPVTLGFRREMGILGFDGSPLAGVRDLGWSVGRNLSGGLGSLGHEEMECPNSKQVRGVEHERGNGDGCGVWGRVGRRMGGWHGRDV